MKRLIPAVVLAVSLSLVSPGLAMAAPVETRLGAQVDETTLQTDMRLAVEHTQVNNTSTPHFEFDSAVDQGMSVAFALSYRDALQRLQRDSQWPTPPLRSDPPSDAPSSFSDDCVGCELDSTPRYTSEDVMWCWVSQLGMTIATAAAVASIVASGGMMALALAGFGFSAISVIRDCYK